MTSVAHNWLSEAVESFADAVVLLDRDLRARPGNPGVRADREAARNLLRMTLARSVYAEHPDWVYQRQYREFMAREREAIAQAAARLNGETGGAS